MIRKTISMPDAMGDWIDQRLASGQYNNESEYFRDLIRKDQEDELKRRILLQRLDEAEANYAAGRFTELASDDDIASAFAEIESEVDKG